MNCFAFFCCFMLLLHYLIQSFYDYSLICSTKFLFMKFVKFFLEESIVNIVTIVVDIFRGEYVPSFNSVPCRCFYNKSRVQSILIKDRLCRLCMHDWMSLRCFKIWERKRGVTLCLIFLPSNLWRWKWLLIGSREVIQISIPVVFWVIFDLWDFLNFS